MSRHYVTPTERPQWPSERVRAFVREALVWYVAPFFFGGGIVLVMLAAHILAGGRW